MDAIALLYNKYNWEIPESEIKEATCTIIKGKSGPTVYYIYIYAIGEHIGEWNHELLTIDVLNLLAQAILDNSKETDTTAREVKSHIYPFLNK